MNPLPYFPDFIVTTRVPYFGGKSVNSLFQRGKRKSKVVSEREKSQEVVHFYMLK